MRIIEINLMVGSDPGSSLPMDLGQESGDCLFFLSVGANMEYLSRPPFMEHLKSNISNSRIEFVPFKDVFCLLHQSIGNLCGLHNEQFPETLFIGRLLPIGMSPSCPPKAFQGHTASITRSI